MAAKIDTNPIAWPFIGQFYKIWEQSGDERFRELAKLYKPEVSILTFEGNIKYGQQEIVAFLQSTFGKYKSTKFVVSTMYSQPTVDNGIIAAVLGQVKIDEDNPRIFSQTFHLKWDGSGTGQWFIMNEIFQLTLHNIAT